MEFGYRNGQEPIWADGHMESHQHVIFALHATFTQHYWMVVGWQRYYHENDANKIVRCLRAQIPNG